MKRKRSPSKLFVLLCLGIAFCCLSIFISSSFLPSFVQELNGADSWKDNSFNTLQKSEYLFNLRLAQLKQETNLDEITSGDYKQNPTIEKKPLNVVLLYPDDWRHDDVGGLAPVVRTPFLNMLAQKGVHFTYNAVTTSICWVSRATMFTGQWVSRHASSYRFQPKFAAEAWRWSQTWPYLLQQHGYYVGHIGKWQYHGDGKLYNLRSIFNFTRVFEGEHWYKIINSNGTQTKINAADKAVHHTLEFLEGRPKHKPFAITVAFYPPKPVGEGVKPGEQWTPKNETKRIYENEFIPYPPYNISDAYHSLPKFIQDDRSLAKQRWIQRWSTDEHYQLGMKNYYSLITEVDRACEKIVNILEREGLLENTMVIFTTDNGLFHGAHGLAGKWYPYQESIRVPLIIYDPRMPAEKRGTKDDSLTLNVDLAETILGAAGLHAHPMMQGRDIADLYLSNFPMSAKPWRTDFYYEYPIGGGLPKDPRSTALVQKDWKYIHWDEKNYDQLFDLINDPLELNDLATNITQKNKIRLKLMKDRHKKLRYEAMAPVIPGSECDPLWRPGETIPLTAPVCYNITGIQKFRLVAKRQFLIYLKMLARLTSRAICTGHWESILVCSFISELHEYFKHNTLTFFTYTT